ncbi:hypothetical protein QJS66_01035 [Kocuria rhizophila]|nr:hypothetical protein QJS66_01035 [Kocuria rhizophila]
MASVLSALAVGSSAGSGWTTRWTCAACTYVSGIVGHRGAGIPGGPLQDAGLLRGALSGACRRLAARGHQLRGPLHRHAHAADRAGAPATMGLRIARRGEIIGVTCARQRAESAYSLGQGRRIVRGPRHHRPLPGTPSSVPREREQP